MTLDADLVRSRCGEIEESVARLERLASLRRSDLLGDQDSLDIACYRLLVAIEAALALCHHVSPRHWRRVPEDYAACFAILHEGGAILPTCPLVCSRWRDSAICWCTSTGRSITGRSTRSSSEIWETFDSSHRSLPR